MTAEETAYLIPGCWVAIFRKTWPELQRSIWDEVRFPQTWLSSEQITQRNVVVVKPASAQKPRIRIAVLESDPLRFVGFRVLFSWRYR